MIKSINSHNICFVCVYFFFSHYIYIDRTPEFSLFILGCKNIIHQLFNITVLIFSDQKKKIVCISTFVPLFLFDLLISSFWSQCLVFPRFYMTRTISAGFELNVLLNRNSNTNLAVGSILKCALHF